MIRVELLDAETAWTDESVGRKRQANAEEQHRKPRGGQAEHEAPAAHILGGRCEAVSYKWAKPVKWNWFHQGLEKLPDLHDFIDVKGVDKPHYNLMVKPDDPAEWAYLFVDGSAHPFYDIVGWCWGFEAKTKPLEERKANVPTHFVDRGDPLLKNPELLLLVLRERQQFPERSAAASAHP